jgi:hypothetical protein
MTLLKKQYAAQASPLAPLLDTQAGDAPASLPFKAVSASADVAFAAANSLATTLQAGRVPPWLSKGVPIWQMPSRHAEASGAELVPGCHRCCSDTSAVQDASAHLDNGACVTLHEQTLYSTFRVACAMCERLRTCGAGMRPQWRWRPQSVATRGVSPHFAPFFDGHRCCSTPGL